MDILVMIWLIMGGAIVVSVIVFVLMIAGKDMLFAMKRWFMQRGAYVFLVNSSRFADIHYLVPKENTFRINGALYATNPKKCINVKERYMHISEAEQAKIKKSLDEKEYKLIERKTRLDDRRFALIEQFKTKYGEKPDEEAQVRLAKALSPLENEIKRIDERLGSIDKAENYYFKSRPAFFFIENDPIPKDFFELYSEFDSKILDNLAARAATSSAKLTGDKSLEIIKWLAIAAAVAAVIAAVVALRTQSMLNTLISQMGTSIGTSITV